MNEMQKNDPKETLVHTFSCFNCGDKIYVRLIDGVWSLGCAYRPDLCKETTDNKYRSRMWCLGCLKKLDKAKTKE